MKRIAVICPHPVGVAPGQRLKYEQYFDSWRKDGWIVDVYPFQSMRFWNINPKKGYFLEKVFWTLVGYFHRILLIFSLRKYDVTYIFLWVTPLGPPVFEWLYRRVSKKIIYDIDDLVFMGNTSDANSWVSKLKGKQKPIYLMKRANHIITTTPYLVRKAEGYNEHVTSIPPTLPKDFLMPIEGKSNEPPIIGWSGSASTLQYLNIISDVLKEVYKTYTFKLVILGVKDYKLEGIDVICYPWSEENEKKIIPTFDIALYPLKKEEWSEGKYGGKMIQYLAAGLPMIVSNANEVIKEVLENDETAIIVENTKDAWQNALIDLLSNREKRNVIAKNARTLFEKKYTVEGNQNTYLQILDSLTQ